MYPNPAKTEVTLSWNQSTDVTIRIFDTQGKLMYLAKDENILEPKAIDISNFSTGLYFVRVNNTDGFVTKKLVIE